MTVRWKARAMAALCPLVLAVGCGVPGDDTAAGGAVVQNQGGTAYSGSGSVRDGYRGLGLDRPYQMPDLTLTDTTGSPYHLVRDTNAPVTLVFFGYTNCPDVCGLVMADLAAAYTRLDPEVARQVEVLFITTDPARDTPPVVDEYVGRFHPDFEGLTGPLPKIKAAAKPLGVAIQGMNRLPSGGYEVGHSSQVIGFAADDTARVVWTQGTPVDHLVEDIRKLANLPR